MVMICVGMVSPFVLFMWEFYYYVNSFLYRFLGCWLSVASFIGVFVMFKRDSWLMLKAMRGRGQEEIIFSIHKAT